MKEIIRIEAVYSSQFGGPVTLGHIVLKAKFEKYTRDDYIYVDTLEGVSKHFDTLSQAVGFLNSRLGHFSGKNAQMSVVQCLS